MILVADLILVMDRGKIVEHGTHKQLSEGRRVGYIVSCMKHSFEESACRFLPRITWNCTNEFMEADSCPPPYKLIRREVRTLQELFIIRLRQSVVVLFMEGETR